MEKDIQNRKRHLLGMDMEQLREVADICALPRYTAKQIADWIYKKRVSDIEGMTNISAANRKVLAEKYDVGFCQPLQSSASSDGTVKYLFETAHNGFIETVMIPDEVRTTLCVSTQVGCKMNCLFCMTGKQGFSGQLSAAEILNQIYSIQEHDKLTNLVFMGMGEPLDNFDEVKKVIDILTAGYALGWSPKRITLSTIGVIPQLRRFLTETNVHLAVSIHNADPVGRLSVMPVEKAYPIEDVVDLLKEYDWSGQRRLSFEYVMLKGVNDSITHAKKLVSLLSGIECRVNLIPFHQIPNVELRPSEYSVIQQFCDYLVQKRVRATIRQSRGQDIDAACGMLSTKEHNNKNKDLA